jgi:hypothetical protein
LRSEEFTQLFQFSILFEVLNATGSEGSSIERKVSPEIYPVVRIAIEQSSFMTSLSSFSFPGLIFLYNDINGHDQSSVGSDCDFDGLVAHGPAS